MEEDVEELGGSGGVFGEEAANVGGGWGGLGGDAELVEEVVVFLDEVIVPVGDELALPGADGYYAGVAAAQAEPYSRGTEVPRPGEERLGRSLSLPNHEFSMRSGVALTAFAAQRGAYVARGSVSVVTVGWQGLFDRIAGIAWYNAWRTSWILVDLRD